MLAVLALTVLGTGVGVVTGLTPGIHPNTLIAISLPLLLDLPPGTALPLIAAAATAHSVLNHIPAILIGVPDQDSALAALPGKQMLLQGNGFTAAATTINGGLRATTLTVLSLPVLLLILGPLYQLAGPYLPFLVSVVFGVMVIDADRVHIALGITVLSSVVGMLTLTAPLPSEEALFPLFTGLFGVPVLVASRGGEVPEQEPPDDAVVLPARGSAIGSLAGILAGILPGLGPSATVALFARYLDRHQFLAALGGINTADALVSIVALYAIGRPRSGAAIAVQQLVRIDSGTLLLVVGASLIAVSGSYIIGKVLLPHVLAGYNMLDQERLTNGLLSFLTVLVGIVAGPGGLAILTAATGVGLLCHRLHAPMTLCMACLIVPFLLHSFGVTL